ncbi:MAG: 50S ribosomal protein L23 [Deltaproteobacteria bacterium]|jgi:large subunit ribosomal protein L23|nr:50S ribosomal protein L23 [Deltaproteobacteria bacterium]MCK5422779.1 50S ribosomal protein L23 [Deltaproteobacteria bacterium]
MKNTFNILKKPLITEKSNLMKEELSQITFEVDKKANKIEIKKAVEKLFKVHVTKVHTINMLGKRKRLGKSQGKRPDRKKAIVTLKEGDRIEFFEGV